MKILKAKHDILLENHQFVRGDILPADNDLMVAAWIKAGTAEWEESNITADKQEKILEQRIPEQMGIVELKQYAKNKGISAAGTKKDILERLKEADANE